MGKSITLQKSALIERGRAEEGSDAGGSERAGWDGARRARARDPRHSCSQSITARLAIGASHGGEKGSNEFESHGGGSNEFDKRGAGAGAGAAAGQVLALSTFKGDL